MACVDDRCDKKFIYLTCKATLSTFIIVIAILKNFLYYRKTSSGCLYRLSHLDPNYLHNFDFNTHGSSP